MQTYQMLKFSDVFSDAVNFWNQMEIFRTSIPFVSIEPYDVTQWFTISDIKTLIYNLFISKTYHQVFIWPAVLPLPDPEFEAMIAGVFKITFFEQLTILFQRQQTLVSENISDFKDFNQLGGQTTANSQGATSAHASPQNPPSTTSYQWGSSDAPNNKSIVENTGNVINRLENQKQLLESRLQIYLEAMFAAFQRFFIPQYF